MHRKITSRALILISGFVFCFTLCRAAADIFADKAQIESLIESGKLADAHLRIEKLKADYGPDSQLPCALFWIGRKFEWSNKYDEAKDIYQQIIQNHAGDSYAQRARIGLPRIEVLTLVVSNSLEEAEVALDKLLADFATNPDLPGSLYWIAERYRWAHKWEDAKDLYRKIIQNYPDNPYAVEARLGLARLEVLALIASDNYGAAKKALDKLVTVSPTNPDLPETLYWIAEDFRWANQYETAKSTYLHIIENYPASSYASRARLGFAQANICSLISLGQPEEVQAATEKMKTEFAGYPDLPDVLYSIALRLEWSNNYEQAKAAYQQVPQESPGVNGDIQLDIARMNVCSLIASEQFQAAQSALNDLIADFNDHPDIVETVLTVGEEYAEKAYQYEDRGDTEKTREYAQRAIEVCKKIITDFPPCDLTAQAYFSAATFYKMLGEFDKAIQYSRKTLDQWPDFRSAWQAQYMIGLCYEQLEASGEISRAEAAAQINQVCQKLAGYPAPQARIAARGLLKKWALTEN